MQNQGKNWLHNKLQAVMGPSLIILIGSSIFRGLLGLIIMIAVGQFGSYNHWSWMIKLPIEVIVFLGVFITSDVCFAATVTNCEAEKRKRNEILNEEMPRFKGSDKAIQQQTEQWMKTRELRIRFIEDELKTERQARTFFGGVSISYALNFVAQGIFTFDDGANTAIMALIEILTIIVGVYVIWYYSARYKTEKADPLETATALVETGMEKRLEKTAANFQAGEPTEDDLNLADAALAKGHHYKRFVAAMRRPPANDEILTTGDIFASLGIIDATAQRAIRRIIKAAFDRHVAGVYQVPVGTKTEWRVDGKAYYTLFKNYLKHGQSTDKQRTNKHTQASDSQGSTGQGQDNNSPASGDSGGQPDTPELTTSASGTPHDTPQVNEGAAAA